MAAALVQPKKTMMFTYKPKNLRKTPCLVPVLGPFMPGHPARPPLFWRVAGVLFGIFCMVVGISEFWRATRETWAYRRGDASVFERIDVDEKTERKDVVVNMGRSALDDWSLVEINGTQKFIQDLPESGRGILICRLRGGDYLSVKELGIEAPAYEAVRWLWLHLLKHYALGLFAFFLGSLFLSAGFCPWKWCEADDPGFFPG